MTTVRQKEEQTPEPEAGDYFVLCTREANWYLSTAMARVVERELNLAGPDDWVTFVDIHGARIRLRAGLVQYLAQCFATNRAEERRFWRNRKKETQAERDWEDD